MSSIIGISTPANETEYYGMTSTNLHHRMGTESGRATGSKSAALQNLILAAVVIFSGVAIWWFWPREIDMNPIDDATPTEQLAAAGPVNKKELEKIPFDGAQAYEYLKQICAIGPRASGSEGMVKQRKLLVEHFKKAGATVTLQEFPVRHPLNGSKVEMANIIVSWHPESKERVMLSAHYDTRPYPDEDPRNPKGVFVGANDGGSGVAVMMEMARHMPGLKGKYGVDFVFFDGEEMVYRVYDQFVRGKYDDKDKYFHGSEYFATDYAANPPKHTYRWAVNLDMVGSRTLQLPVEATSWGWAECQPLIREIWGKAKELGVKEFKNELGKAANDDHVPLHNIGKIAAIDLIDFEYPFWHTMADKPENCSPVALAKVGWVLHEWLKSAK